MKIYDWIIVVSLMILSNLITLFLVKEYLHQDLYSELKVVDVKSLIDENNNLIREAYISGRIDKDQAEEYREQFIKALEKAIKETDGIILPRQAVIGGNVDDITESIKRKIVK